MHSRIPTQRPAHSTEFLHPVVAILWLILCASAVAETHPTPDFSTTDEIVGDVDLGRRALELAEAYHHLDTARLKTALGPGFRFIDQAMGQDLDAEAFLEMVVETGQKTRDRSMRIDWIGVVPATESGLARIDLRGLWTATPTQTRDGKPLGEKARPLELIFSIQLEMADGKLVHWTDTFRRRRLFLPVLGDGQHRSDHFDIRFLTREFTPEKAAKLAPTLEAWYRRTADYLGREFEGDRRVLIDIASYHQIPYASAPGPEAFFLVSVEHASKDYGFSLVHELTHNLAGRSALSNRPHEDFPGGNRLLDEGFGVYVEERLVPNSRMFPNFGTEIHRAYLELEQKLETPRPPVLDAERLRMFGRGEEPRLGYLQQSSFVKWLIDTADVEKTEENSEASNGLERFLKLFARGLEATQSLYGKDLDQLEGEWTEFLKKRAETL